MRRSVLVAVAAWVGVVALVSAAVWWVIEAAGTELLAETRAPVSGTPAPGTTRASTPAPGTTRASTPTPAASPPSGTSRPTPAAPSGPATSRGPTPAPPSSSGAAGTADAATSPVVRTWQHAAGTVTVRCTGADIALQGASPADGYALEIDKRGPQEVEVELESEQSRVRLESRCAGGAPTFSVDSQGGSGRD